jgi:hypothetical protein
MGVTFTIYKGTTISDTSLVSVTAINPVTFASSVVSFYISATDGIATGGDIVADVNGQRVHIFTSPSSTLTMLASGSVSMLLVGGGGGGGAGYGGGGGGAGGVIYRSGYSLAAGTYSVTVGTGGNGGYAGIAPSSGGNTILQSIFTAIGGGAGGTDQSQIGGAIVAALSGGSGGGGSTTGTQAGSGTEGQGYTGGAGTASQSGGGGGAGGAGSGVIVIITSDGGAYAQYGFSSAISQDGSTLVVGAPWASNGDGFAAVYTPSTGVRRAIITSTAGAGAQFGTSVAVSADGSRIVVGAPLASSGAGYAAVFDASGTLVATLTGSGSQFGFSVAISGNKTTVAVGTPSSDGTAGYVNVYSGASYSTSVPVVYTSAGAEYFGQSVSLSNDGSVVVIGAPNKSNGSGYAAAFLTSSGALYREFISVAGTYAYFGFSVAISGDGTTAVVGAPTANNNAGYVGVYNVLSTALQSTLINTQSGTSQFGYAVSVSTTGSVAIASAPLADTTGAGGQGGYAGTFNTQTGTVIREYTSQYPMTGSSVSLSSNYIAAVGCAGVETLPFRVDGAVSIYF